MLKQHVESERRRWKNRFASGWCLRPRRYDEAEWTAETGSRADKQNMQQVAKTLQSSPLFPLLLLLLVLLLLLSTATAITSTTIRKTQCATSSQTLGSSIKVPEAHNLFFFASPGVSLIAVPNRAATNRVTATRGIATIFSHCDYSANLFYY